MALFLALFLLTIYLINFKNNKENIKFWGLVIFSTLISNLPTLGLYLRHTDIVGPSGRNPWQSNVFGGRLSDILVSSPFLNQKFNLLEKLNEAVSPEARITQFGTIFGIGVIISLIYFVSSLIRQFEFMPQDMHLLIFTFLIFFILGGLGNLQASILFLMNQISPARSWSRLIIFIGILGLFIIFKFLEHKNLSFKFIFLTFTFLILFSFLDLNAAKKPEFLDKRLIDEYKSINFIQTSTKKCPVLQLPLDTYPIPQDFLFENGGKFVYNEFIPYLLSENNQWSVGGTPFNNYWIKNISLPRNIDSNYFIELKNQGYCAVLFDKDFAKWQIGRNAGINTETGDLTNWGNWPGVEISNVQPDYEDTRYSVYLLK